MIQKMLLCTALAVAALTGPSQAQLPGGKIAYLSEVFGTTSATLCVMDPDGGNAVDVAQIEFAINNGWWLFPITWSPDGTQLAYMVGQDIYGGDIYTVRVAGGAPVKLTSHGRNELNKHPAWSPDGTRIAFASMAPSATAGKLNTDIYVMNADGSNPVNLMAQQPEAANSTDELPAWSPDGSKIAFRSDRAGGEDFQIFVMNADGTDPIQLTHETTLGTWSRVIPELKTGCGSVAWSPDGRRLAFDVIVERHLPRWYSEIDVMDIDGGNRVRVSEAPGVKSETQSPSWSPDGSKIVFTSDRRYGHFDIWMVNPDGSDLVRVSQVASTTPYQMFPAWSPLPRGVVAPSAVRALSWGQVKVGGW